MKLKHLVILQATILLGLLLVAKHLAPEYQDTAPLTYTKDTKPVFNNRCSVCHDYMGDKNWQVYANAFKYKDKIKEKILSKEMPSGRDMPQDERDLVVRWVDEGAKE